MPKFLERKENLGSLLVTVFVFHGDSEFPEPTTNLSDLFI